MFAGIGNEVPAQTRYTPSAQSLHVTELQPNMTANTPPISLNRLSPDQKSQLFLDTTQKTITRALKTNIGHSIGNAMANLIVELSNHSFKLDQEQGPEYFKT